MTYALGGEAEHYQPPDDGPECLWCDGTLQVEITSITDAVSYTHLTLPTILRV